MTTVVTLQPVSGQEISRRQMPLKSAIAAMSWIRETNGAGYIIVDGEMFPMAPCRTDTREFATETPRDAAMKILARLIVGRSWGSRKVI